MGIWRKIFICKNHRIWGQREVKLALQVEEELVWPEASSKEVVYKIYKFMTEKGYSRCHFDHFVYFKRLNNERYIILLLYVDDMLVAGSNIHDINVLKRKLDKSFAKKDLGVAKQILGMRIIRDRKNRKLTLSQGEYIEKVLEGFRMQNEKLVSKPLANHFKLRRCVPRHMKR